MKLSTVKASGEGCGALPVIAAFLAIYLLWGGTYLAIRIAVLEMPPFLTAGVRFLTAGGLLYVLLRSLGQPAPSLLQWRGIAVVALSMFAVTYSALFWAEQARALIAK